MFTGIIEATGTLKSIKREGTNIHFEIESLISNELKVDQSVSHNGVCLTTTQIDDGSHWVTAIDETLTRSNLGDLIIGDTVNLERCMLLNDRLDGHIVQGHVDQTSELLEIIDENGSWRFRFRLDTNNQKYVVQKGSICLNGISLTIADLRETDYSVAIIPYTYENTNFNALRVGQKVNVEFDIVGKYILRNLGVEAALKSMSK
jgi:riboflavin synthase